VVAALQTQPQNGSENMRPLAATNRLQKRLFAAPLRIFEY